MKISPLRHPLDVTLDGWVALLVRTVDSHFNVHEAESGSL